MNQLLRRRGGGCFDTWGAYILGNHVERSNRISLEGFGESGSRVLDRDNQLALGEDEDVYWSAMKGKRGAAREAMQTSRMIETFQPVAAKERRPARAA